MEVRVQQVCIAKNILTKVDQMVEMVDVEETLRFLETQIFGPC